MFYHIWWRIVDDSFDMWMKILVIFCAGDGCILGTHGIFGVREAEVEGAGTATVSGELVVER